jgi:hypothetical protein
MALRGKGMLIVYTDIGPRHERDFNEWYNREHIDERVNLPGFYRGRRYVSVKGPPKYLATYECDSVADLATPSYLALLANQTAWTQTTMKRFSSFKRMAVRIQIDRMHGEGGALTTLRFVPDPARRRPLIDWLNQTLEQAIKRPGMTGAAVAENDLEVANAPMQSGSMDRPRADQIEWVLMLEGADAKATGSAARALFKTATLKPFGVAKAPVIGTYQFLFGNART